MTDLIPAWRDGTFEPVEKLLVHQLGLRHLAISVFVMAGRQILIQRRALGKYHTPGLWANTCCTHPHWGESAADCAARRLREELGITGLSLSLSGEFEYRADVGNGLTEHELVSIFTAQAPMDLALTLDPAEVAETRWIDIDALCAEIDASPQAFTPWLRIYLGQHRTEILGRI